MFSVLYDNKNQARKSVKEIEKGHRATKNLKYFTGLFCQCLIFKQSPFDFTWFLSLYSEPGLLSTLRNSKHPLWASPVSEPSALGESLCSHAFLVELEKFEWPDLWDPSEESRTSS